MKSFVAAASLLLINLATTVGQTSDFAALQQRLEIASFGLNAASLHDPSSYQHQAMQRTSQQIGVDGFSDAKLVQYYALYCIYFSTYAMPNHITNDDPRFVGIVFPIWLISTNWDQVNVDPCNGWHGISCDSDGKVTNIDLYENTLTGTWPDEVKLLAADGPFSTGAGKLTQVDLFANEFLTGDASWISDLGSSVTTIMLQQTGFSGDLPVLPESIVNFNAAEANFTGGFNDATFALCNNLNYLDLEMNQFNTKIPSALSALLNLQYVYLSDTLITGTLAPLHGSPAIRELWMDANPLLTGPIEPWIGSLTTLESLSLAYNGLTGELPSELGLLTELKQVWLYGNNVTGTIPSELGSLNQLSVLQLEGNRLVGWAPRTVCEKTEFPLHSLKAFGADCYNDGFWCPCCTCCDLADCLGSSAATRKERKQRRRYLR